MTRLFTLFSILLICSCTINNLVHADSLGIDSANLPSADLHLIIPGLRPCTDSKDNTIHLSSDHPVTILTHGCLDSTARFRALSDVFAFHGQQAVCFTYNDRDSLMKSSGELISAINKLSRHIEARKITVIGHSMGGLISRKALVADRQNAINNHDINVRLVTISTPFLGISDARYCASPTAIILSLGTVIPICKLISGDKWHEITYASDFIRKPGKLIDSVDKHIKIVTDERGFCRKYNTEGSCIEDDFVFSIEEQYYLPVDRVTVVTNIEVKAGHVEIVGDTNTAPLKLIRLLQEKGVMNITEAWREEELQALLVKLY
jgi:hypothetical protein